MTLREFENESDIEAVPQSTSSGLVAPGGKSLGKH